MAIPSETSASAAERRQLTVLFCDLVGSTELSQTLDAEDLRELVLGYQETVSKAVERYEGHIAQYLGDGVLVYFGHPMAHDNDAERAVRAAYDLLAALKARKSGVQGDGAALQVRIGIHTGSVVIGQVGAGGRHENLALGDTTNIAARLQGIAEPNQIVISHATRKLVPGLFVTRDLGEVALKGITIPMQVYQVLQPSGMRSRLEASDYLTPFVGRELELAMLLDSWSHAQDGQGGGAVVTAEPGLGKSRLLFTLHERIQESSHSWLECRCSSFGQNSAWQPLIEMIQTSFGIKDGDNAKARLTSLEYAVDALGLKREDAVPLFAALLNIDLPKQQYAPLQISPELRRRKTMELLVDGTLALARTQPLVLIVEDLHWADPSTIELLAMLLDQVPTHPILVVMTARPEFQPPWRIKTHLTALSLRPLRAKEATQMLDSLADKPLAPGVQTRVLERAGGVPLFVEEIVKMLLESGQLIDKAGVLDAAGHVDELKIPESLQDSLMARLDRLNDAKLLIQQCSVIGREIPYRLIAALSTLDESALQGHLKSLIDAQLLYPRGSPPDSSYIFKHALIQDSAYNSLLKATRHKLHAVIAAILEQQFPNRAKAEPAVLAQHFDAAADAANAVRWYIKAADLSANRGAHPEVVDYAERSLRLIAGMDDEQQRMRRELRISLLLATSKGAMQGYFHPQVEQLQQRIGQLSEQVNDPSLKATALIQIALGALNRASNRELARYVSQLSAIAASLNSRLMRASAMLLGGAWKMCAGRLADAGAELDAAITETDPGLVPLMHQFSGLDSLAGAFIYKALVNWLGGYPERAAADCNATEGLVNRFKNPLMICMSSCIGLPTFLNMQRDLQGALTTAQAGLETAREFGLGTPAASAEMQCALAGHALGHADGPQLMRATVEKYRGLGNRHFLSFIHGVEAAAHLEQGRVAEARAALAAAFEMVEKHEELFWAAELHRVQGELHRAESPDDIAGAERHFQKSLQISREQGAKSLELRTAMSLARLWQRQGRAAEARGLLKPVYDWFTEGFDTPDLKDAKALLVALA